MSKDAPKEDKKSPLNEEGSQVNPAFPGSASSPTTPDDQTSSDAASSISDEEARLLLAEMDAPYIPEDSRDTPAVLEEPPHGPSALHPPLAPEKAETIKGVTATSHTGDETAVEEDIVEVEEFSRNEFASDPNMLQDFSQNAGELMETLDQNVLSLEQNPRDREIIESIFRAAHTLKGAAGMFGFHAIERVMHRMENLFDLVRKGTLVPTADTIDVVFRGLDTLRALLSAVESQMPSGIKTVPVVRALDLAIRGKYLKSPPMTPSTPQNGVADPQRATKPEAKSSRSEPPPDGKEPVPADAATGDATQKKSDQSTIRVDLERLDMLVNLVGELVIDRTRFAAIENEIRATAPQLKATSTLSETVQLFGRHMNEIHEIIMKIRMVPIGNAFNKFTRVVRDLSRQLGKDIQINLSGEETELDKTLVEQIGDPLIHLIRNSCDHGIETPEIRLKTGKGQTGTIQLSARQEGHHVIITIADDGKGIPVDAVRRKGLERGLIKEHDVLTNRDIFNLIFEPGFSTAEKVTTVSGRGVGMDVVRKQIGKLKGIIEIDSEQGKGTKTTIRLPLTLAIVQSLLVKSSHATFAIPLSSVIESVRIKPEEIQRIGEAEVIKRHDKVLPLMYLTDVLGMAARDEYSWYDIALPSSGDKNSPAPMNRPASQAQEPLDIQASLLTDPLDQRLFVVIVGSGEKRFGIVVDHLLHQQEMVIKSMGPLMTGVPCIAGGAVLGNGEVVLVLDISELEDTFKSKDFANHAQTA